MNSHLSEEQISGWIAGERSREAEQHLLTCPECAAEVSGTESAMVLFRDSGHQAADYWQRQPSHPRGVLQWVPAGAAITVAIVAVVAFYRPSKPEPMAQWAHQKVFHEIPYVIPPAPYERTKVVHMNVPVAALIQAGLTMNAAAADSVPADVLIGQDGRPLAVAFQETN